jgi:pSer/pThr/pTyr-binding forkhead associated (FHA) protein
MRGALDEPSQRSDAVTQATAHLVLQVTGESEPRVHAVTGPSMTLGRTPTNDIVLDLPWVSREQLVIEFVDQCWRIAPQGAATTPVLYHGTPLTGPVDLQAVDYFRIPGRESGELVTCVLVSGPAPTAVASGSLVVAVGESVAVGSEEDSRLGAGSELLAAMHAVITRHESGWAVEDLSGGHTIIDGQPATARTMPALERVSAGGLRITLGDHGALTFHDASAPFVSAVRRPREVPEDLIGRVEGEGGVPIEARHLLRTVRSGATLLQDLSL